MDYDTYLDDMDYNSEDALFNDFIYRKGTPPFNNVNRSLYEKGTDFKEAIVKVIGDNCFFSE